ncbi:MAG: nitrite reductase small subunit NirD [Akkermansiaceae bacterium]
MNTNWTQIGSVAEFPANFGSCVKVNDTQVAVFNLPTEKKWYAVQNFNPQNERMVLSRGILGDQDGVPIVICPLHKYRYSLDSGQCFTDEQYSLKVYEVKEEQGALWVNAG